MSARSGLSRALNRRAAKSGGQSQNRAPTKRSNALLAAVLLAVSGNALAADNAQVGKGQVVYEKWCAPCHAAGPGHPGTTALAALYKGKKPAALEERKDLSPEIVRLFVRKGVSVMPFFRKTEISDAELDALGAYLARKR